jgi:uncharacterized membrane protein
MLARRIALLGLAAFFLAGGIAHFLYAEFFVAIMPPYLPAHLALVHVSGVLEILGGLGVLHAATRRAAGVGLLVLVVAVFPANLHMALHPEQFAVFPSWALYARLPLQLVILAWVWWAAGMGAFSGRRRK